MGSQKKKLQPYQYCLLREHKSKVEELLKLRNIIYSPWFTKRLGQDERLLTIRQYILTKDLLDVLNARIYLFRKENPKPDK